MQLFTARSGLISAKALLADGTVRHIHSLVDPARESAFYENMCFWGDVIIFAGIGLGYHIARKTGSIPKQAILVVIDYYEKLIEHCRANVFSGLPNTVVAVSEPNFEQSISSANSLLENLPAATVQVVKHPASVSINREFYALALDRLHTSRSKQSAGTVGAIEKALVMFGNFFLEEEVVNAARGLGVEPFLFSYNDFCGFNYEDELLRLLQKYRPSFVLSINMKGFDGNGAFEDITARLGVPVVIWFVDDPRPILMHRLSFIKNNLIAACWEKSYLPYLQKAGFSKVAFMPLATDPKLFSTTTASAPHTQLGFVGTAMVDNFAGNIRDKFLWSDCLAPLVDLVSDRIVADPFYPVETGLRACSQDIGISLPFSDMRNITWLCTYCIHTASMKKRKRIIGGLLDKGIETFGDPEGWKSLFGAPLKTHPNIDYRRSLRDTYADICLNVNITSCQMPQAVNQRVFDIPCCGSFLITDNQADLQKLFDTRRETVVYENLSDLRDKIGYYSAHDTQRNRIASAARKRILQEHTYALRMRSIMQLLRS